MKKLSLLSLILLTLFACRKDVEETINTEVIEGPIITTVINYTPEVINVPATLYGVVVNEGNEPIANATLKLANNTTTTDDKGRFLFKDIQMNQAGTFLTVNQQGYFEGSDRFFPEEGSTNYTRIKLIAKNEIGGFVSSDGGNIIGQDGIELSFPADAIVDGENMLYSGDVVVYARGLDPTDADVHEKMPGGLQGINTDGELMAIASFGMMTVDLETPNGQALNLGNGKKATLTFPINDAQVSGSPEEIPLWSFSNEYGVWVEEGVATKTGSKYVGEVGHFSWWNCDDPYTLIELSGTVLSEGGEPLANQYICLELSSTGEVGCIYTNDDGYFSGPVPMNEEFTMTISSWYGCDAIYTDNIGPFAEDTDLGTILIEEDDQLVEISGLVVDCDDEPVTNGWVDVIVGTKSYSIYVSDGTYSLSFHNCDDLTSLSVQVYDIDALLESESFEYTISNPMTIPAIAACDNQLEEYFTITADGLTTTFPDVDGYVEGLGQDTLLIWASIPGTDWNTNLGMRDLNGVGTYNSDNVSFISYFMPGTNSVFYSGDCSGSTCMADVTFTEFGANPGEFIIGSYSGDMEFTDDMQQPVTLFIEVEFKYKRE
ncbi:MAG: carboxypeptidase-like regulatory domain-containing protein [Saprospiraceae bacterium]